MSSQLKNEHFFESQYLQKLLQIENRLQNYKYQTTIYELTNFNVFNFDIYKVINQTNIQIINKLCINFYKFVIVKIMLGILQSKDSFSNKQSRLNKKYKKITRTSLNSNKQTPIIIPSGKTQHNLKQNKSHKTLQQKSKENKSNKTLFTLVQNQINQILVHKLMQANINLKQAYFSLIEANKNKNGVHKIDIICFIIAMISFNVLAETVQSIYKQFDQQDKIARISKKVKKISFTNQINKNNEHSIEEEVYIVLIYQTLGNFVSANVFKCLKKKYIKHTIFNSEEQKEQDRIIQSLRYIKQKLTHIDGVMVKSRKQKKQEIKKLKRKNSLNGNQSQQIMDKNHFKQFLKQSLKVKQTINLNELDILNDKQQEANYLRLRIKQSLCPNNQRKSSVSKLPIFKQHINVNKCSSSLTKKFSLKVNKLNSGVADNYIKKYVSNVQQIFYKIKQPNKHGQNIIKSERNTCKFIKIGIEDNRNKNYRYRPDYQNIDLMKQKIKVFKVQALKNLQEIQKFKPNQLYKMNPHLQTRKDIKSLTCSKSEKLSIFQTYQNLKGKNAFHDYKNRWAENQQSQKQNKMDSIRKNAIIRSTKLQKPTKSLCFYKLSKNSDKIRRYRQQFLYKCKNRTQILQQDLIKRA